MNPTVTGLAAVLALQAGLAAGQAEPHRHGGHVPRAAAAPPKAKEAPAKPVAATRVGESRGYDAPFADYRPFNAQEPAKPWRAANEEVREAGGHIEVMKALEAAARGKDAKK